MRLHTFSGNRLVGGGRALLGVSMALGVAASLAAAGGSLPGSSPGAAITRAAFSATASQAACLPPDRHWT
jgi:hypothetical protein